MPSATLRFSRLSFAFREAAPILTEVSFHLVDGWTGLVGENGAGKSTLLRLITGELVPDSGSLERLPATASVALCQQELPEPTAELHRLDERQDGEAERAKGMLGLHALPLSRWSSLSPGERKRWQLAATLALEPAILLLDEPTNHVDRETKELLLSALRRFRGLGVVVSHDRAFLEALTSRTLRLARGGARLYDASYGAAKEQWEQELRGAWQERSAAQQEARRAAEKLAEARRVRESAERSMSGKKRDPKDRDARTLVAKTRRSWAEARMGGNVHRDRAAAERAERAIPEVPEQLEAGGSIFMDYLRAPKPLLLSLECERLMAGETQVLEQVRAYVKREARIRLEGVNGAGKTTLLRAMLSASTLPEERILYLPQELEPEAGAELLAEIRALEPLSRGRVLSLLARLGSDPARVMASSAPSPGEARKLALALGLGRHSWLLLLDEPTNHLDLPTVERLERALEEYPGALLFVSHDEAFGARAAQTTWRIEEGRLREV